MLVVWSTIISSVFGHVIWGRPDQNSPPDQISTSPASEHLVLRAINPLPSVH